MQPTARIPVALDMAFVSRDPAFVGKAGEVLPATLLTMRPDNVCLIAQAMGTLIWKHKNASVKDSGRATIAPRVRKLLLHGLLEPRQQPKTQRWFWVHTLAR